jgi:arylsulfatase A-like enzyme
MSEGYLQQVERVDTAFGVLLEGITADTTLLVHSDHGGHERTHGTDSPEDMTIPWLIMGPGIKQGHEIETAVSLLDTAPTLAHIMDVPVHHDWEGHCISEIFETNLA